MTILIDAKERTSRRTEEDPLTPLTVGHLALPQNFVEALAQGEVRLVLGTLEEALDLAGARVVGEVGRRGESLAVRLGSRSGGDGGRSRRLRAAAAEGAGEGVADDVALEAGERERDKR